MQMRRGSYTGAYADYTLYSNEAMNRRYSAIYLRCFIHRRWARLSASSIPIIISKKKKFFLGTIYGGMM